MAKIDLVSEILKHPDNEVVEFLRDKMQAVVKVYGSAKDSNEFYACTDAIGLVFNILKAMDERNKNKAGINTKVVL